MFNQGTNAEFFTSNAILQNKCYNQLFYKIMNALHSALQILKEKHKDFIGNRKDQITSANADGFKQGLAWAIDTIETTIEQEQFEEQYNKELEELISLQNRYKYDENGNCDGFPS